MKKKRKGCDYYCAGLCYWRSDLGEVCGTENRQYEGFCPMDESDRELEDYVAFIKAQEEKELNQKTEPEGSAKP